MLAHLSTGQEAAALRDFNPANVGSGVKTGKSQTEQMFSGVLPKADLANRSGSRIWDPDYSGVPRGALALA
jgi:hypothetical protein